MSIITILADRFFEDFLSDLIEIDAPKTTKPVSTEPCANAAPAQLPPQTAQLSSQTTQLCGTQTSPLVLDP